MHNKAELDRQTFTTTNNFTKTPQTPSQQGPGCHPGQGAGGAAGERGERGERGCEVGGV